MTAEYACESGPIMSNTFCIVFASCHIIPLLDRERMSVCISLSGLKRTLILGSNTIDGSKVYIGCHHPNSKVFERDK
jgi:hypothetical protein